MDVNCEIPMMIHTWCQPTQPNSWIKSAIHGVRVPQSCGWWRPRSNASAPYPPPRRSKEPHRGTSGVERPPETHQEQRQSTGLASFLAGSAATLCGTLAA